MVTVAVEGTAAPRLCTLFYWIDGRFLRRRLTPAHLEAVGCLTARLHQHSVHLAVPAGFDRPTVDKTDGEAEEDVVRLFMDHFSPEAAHVMREVFRRVRRAQEEDDPSYRTRTAQLAERVVELERLLRAGVPPATS